MLQAIGMVLNRQNEKAVLCAKKASDYLLKSNIVAVDLQTEELSVEPDLIITFGGDGTLLTGVGYALKYNIPLLGINLGTVGFLTEEDPDHLEDALKKITEDRFQIEERSLLRIFNKGTGEIYYALNDAVITRGG